MTGRIPLKEIRPCIFCMDENSHARAYPVAGNPTDLYCPTCHSVFDVTEYDDDDMSCFRAM